MYSTAFLSNAFWDKSKNCRFLAFVKYAPMRRKAGALSRLFDATDRKVSVLGMRRAWRIGLRIFIRR